MHFAKIFNLLLGIVLATLVAPHIFAQDLPPIKEAVESERSVSVGVSNSKQGAPILATARLQMSQRAYGNGKLVFKNISQKSVVAFRGVWEINLDNNEVVRNGWNYGGASSVAKGGVVPGEGASFPVAGPPTFSADESAKINRIGLKITGVVYRDGTYWGEEGSAVLSRLKTDIKNHLIVAEKVRAACLKTSVQEFAVQLNNTKATELIPDTTYRMLMQHMFYKDGALRPDVLQILDNYIEALKSWN